MAETFDCIVVGGGGMGSATAYYLAKAGQKVLLLEQFEFNHLWGSSWGHSRIIRYSYTNPVYVQLARETYPLWHALEEATGERFYIKTGGIDFGYPDEPTFRDTKNALDTSSIPYELLNAKEAQARFPQFRFQDDWQVIYQADSGIVPPSRAVNAHLRLAKAHGATLRDNTPVLKIAPFADSVEVHTEDAVYKSAKLVITAGSWAGKLIQETTGSVLPLQPLRVQEVLFNSPDDSYTHEHMPIYIYHADFDKGGGLYGLPSIEGSGVKSGIHGGLNIDHPSHINYTPDEDAVPKLRHLIKDFLPMSQSADVKMVRVCLYTMTPDQDFVIDQHPTYPHIAIGAGFSGHGFKFSTGIGKILTDLTLTGRTPHNISLFNLNRFLG